MVRKRFEILESSLVARLYCATNVNLTKLSYGLSWHCILQKLADMYCGDRIAGANDVSGNTRWLAFQHEDSRSGVGRSTQCRLQTVCKGVERTLKTCIRKFDKMPFSRLGETMLRKGVLEKFDGME